MNTQLMAATMPAICQMDGKSLFILHEGTKVQILDRLGDWSKVEISDGRQGWMKASDVEAI